MSRLCMKKCSNQKKILIKTLFCCVLENLKEIKKYKYSIFRYNRFDIKKWCTLKRDTYCQLPFSSVSLTHKPNTFSSYSLHYLLFFIDIIFIFMKCSLSVKSLLIYCWFCCMVVKGCFGGIREIQNYKIDGKREIRFLNRVHHWNVFYF